MHAQHKIRTWFFAAIVMMLSGAFIAFGDPVTWRVAVTYYDFHSNGSCPEFERFQGGSGTPVLTGLVLDTLDLAGRPIKNPARGTTDNPTSGLYVDNVGKWFRDWVQSTDTSYRNMRINDSLDILSDTADGMLYCLYSGDFFFPIDGRGFGAERLSHNHSFTLHMHNRCRFTPGAGINLTSDDDSWLFINNRLAIDNGGPHVATTRTVSLDSLGLSPNTIYTFDVFFAERKSQQSTFILEMGNVELLDKSTTGGVGVESPAAVPPAGRKIGIGKCRWIEVPMHTARVRIQEFDPQGGLIADRCIANVNEYAGLVRHSTAGVMLIRVQCFDSGNRPLGIVTARFMDGYVGH